MTETWKSIEGHEFYEISSLGRVRSIPRTVSNGTKRKGRLLKPYYKAQPGEGTGSMFVCISSEGKVKRISISRMVYLTFIGEIAEGQVVRFKDGDFKKPSVDNLYATDRKSYMKPFDVMHQTISTEQMKVLIKRRQQKVPYKKISEELGISVGRLSHAFNGRTHINQKCLALAGS